MLCRPYMYTISRYLLTVNNVVAILSKNLGRRFQIFRKDTIMTNTKLKIKMVESGIKQWELARLMEISESALSRKLRDELPEEEQDRIISLIEKAGGDHGDR